MTSLLPASTTLRALLPWCRNGFGTKLTFHCLEFPFALLLHGIDGRLVGIDGDAREHLQPRPVMRMVMGDVDPLQALAEDWIKLLTSSFWALFC